jgi:hypothetical protein
MVSYYTAGDARTLARLSQSMTLRPELASVADKMEIIPEHVWRRMPRDLFHYLLKQETLADIPICEREPADVASKVIPAGSFKIKVYFLVSSSGKTVVFMHLPGD